MTNLSNRQYPLLKHFVRDILRMPIAEAQKFDQRPFRSLLIRGWVAYSPGRGFHVTRGGRDAWEEFEHTSIARTDPTRPLTAYFDPLQYGLTDPYHKKGRRLVVMPKTKTA